MQRSCHNYHLPSTRLDNYGSIVYVNAKAYCASARSSTSCLKLLGSPEGEGCASLGSSARPRRRARGQVASYQTASSPRKIRLISWGSMSLVSDIKLIRTDTTLDLSQKAEKGMKERMKGKGLYSIPQYQRIGQWIWVNKKSHHLLALVLLVCFLSASKGCCRVWFLSFVEGETENLSSFFFFFGLLPGEERI